ncbi:MAG: NADH-quinone oxidoreductase subunit L [Planctomycetia bacterium]|nr:NADH-quinone oxidoreductase subunit L [Planctomycetia bacterium]MCC7316669.1 NADH-quinone oxidoreductase subunit L [Planctomycetota bacterium]
MQYQSALALGVLIPLISFAVLAFTGHKFGKPKASYVALLAIGLSCALSTYVLVGWLGTSTEIRAKLSAEAYRFNWGRIGDIPILIGVKLDSLTVIMYFMVTFIAFWIHFFSIGYMEGHSDEVDHVSKYHRFFTYLSLFCFSMLGLVISSSLLFLFIFWELVGLCSYLLIGFYFDRKYASNAAMKAFITNRVGDFGFIIGLAMVVLYLNTFDLDQAAKNFATDFHSNTGIFAASINLFGWHVSGMTLATLMGICLFCGAMGKSAQFPLHVWLPDAMAGPTPVSALIHAATMVAAGVYLVARVFRLLTPDAQFFVAVIGCITLTITALIAMVQTDIKKVLAYSTLSQLGYMIFGMGVGAWVAALFHLMTHAFFKAMLFLGSGQVIEGCHHEQDMRKMGGLRKKMPVTCWTFFIGVLAIAGFGIPKTDYGLGGFFSKDEILAVAYERTFNLPSLKSSDAAADDAGEHANASDHEGSDPIRLASALTSPAATLSIVQSQLASTDEHGDGDGHGHADAHGTGTPEKLKIAATLPVIPRWMFALPIIIAYITPFYMMRCWWMTFCGKPRDHHVYDHAHENWKMFLPLAVLAAGTVFCSYSTFRPLIHEAAGMATDSAAIVAIDGEAHGLKDAPSINVAGHDGNVTTTATNLTLDHSPGKNPHDWLAYGVGLSWLIGMGIAVIIYRNGLAFADKLKRAFGPIHTALENKLYFDHFYDNVLVAGTRGIGYVCGWFDKLFVDGAVNGVAWLGRVTGSITGRQLDMPVQRGDWGIIDAVANGLAATMLDVGTQIRRPQSGRIRMYVCLTAGAAAIALLAVLYFDQLAAGYYWVMTRTSALAQG